jgi:hypothetical protein
MEKTLHFEQREALKHVLKSRQFIKARKKSRFLEFICEQALVGNADKINEYLIGVEIYERGTDFDPQTDPIVRVQAHEIRRSLKEYYEGDGANEIWQIDIPPGHYVPQFNKKENPAAGYAVELDFKEKGEDKPPSTVSPPKWELEKMVIVCLSVAVLFLLYLLLAKGRPPQQITPVERKSMALPAQMEWFWKDFMPPAQTPLVTMPNHPILRAVHESDPPAVISKAHLIPKENLPEFRETVHYREMKNLSFFPNLTDFTGLGEAIGLLNLFELFARYGQEIRLKPSRLVDLEEVRRGNAILLGGNQLWSNKVYQYPEGFQFTASVIKNPRPHKGEPAIFHPQFDPVTQELNLDYAIIMRLPNEKKDQYILLLYGIYTQGSQAALEYVTNPDRLQELHDHLLALTPDRLQELHDHLLALAPDKKSLPKYFQVLIQTTVENHVPGKSSFVAARMIPE